MEKPETKSKHTNLRAVGEQTVLNRNISLWIDCYDDLFSDFDPRPYNERNISDDFLTEMKKVCGENEFSVEELKLLIPEKMREIRDEEVIVKRLHGHFRSHHLLQEKEFHKKVRKGFLFLLVGIVLMLGAGNLSAHKESSFLVRVLFVITEPAGWFFVWMGLENIFFLPKKEIPDLNFYRKLKKAKVIFTSI